MWLFTKIGFFSVVESPRNPELVIVRGRAWKDLVALEKNMRKRKLISRRREKGATLYQPTESDPGRDYPFRMIVWRSTFSEWMRLHIEEDLNYFNFKAEVGKTNPAREHVYHHVWASLLQLQHEAP